VYGLWRGGEHLFVDGMLGTGSLGLDVRRWSRDANAFGTASRDGEQWFASMSAGYEHHGPALTLTGYGRVEASRATLDAYRESGLGLYDLTYGEQVVANSALALGLEGRWLVGGDTGRLRPFWTVEYREAIDNRGDATMNYAIAPGSSDYRLRMPSYNDNALSLSLGADVRVGRGWLMSFLFGHEQARNATDANSIGLRVSYGTPSTATAASTEADDAAAPGTECRGRRCRQDAAH
jgi:uncharacterized protein YhjY with autotransporter beta-barrel domain